MTSIREQILFELNESLKIALRDFDARTLFGDVSITVGKDFDDETAVFPYVNIVETKNAGVAKDLSGSETFSNLAYAVEIYDKKEKGLKLIDFLSENADAYLTNRLGLRRVNCVPLAKEKIFQDGVRGIALQYECFIDNNTKKIYQFI